MRFFKRCKGRLLCTLLGLAAAVLFLTLGFWKTMVILSCCGIGFAIGVVHDKNLRLPAQWRFWRSKR